MLWNDLFVKANPQLASSRDPVGVFVDRFGWRATWDHYVAILVAGMDSDQVDQLKASDADAFDREGA